MMEYFDLGGKVILMNAPAGAGKDFATQALLQRTAAKHCEFKSTLHNIAMSLTGLSPEMYFSIYENRDLKEAQNPLFLGMSPRQLLITISEKMCKPIFGDDYFGNAAARSLDIQKGSIFSDSGFESEVFPLAEVVGAENIYVVQFTRNNATFAGDSRNYLNPDKCPEGVKFISLTNDGCIESFADEIIKQVNNYGL